MYRYKYRATDVYLKIWKLFYSAPQDISQRQQRFMDTLRMNVFSTKIYVYLAD